MAMSFEQAEQDAKKRYPFLYAALIRLEGAVDRVDAAVGDLEKAVVKGDISAKEVQVLPPGRSRRSGGIQSTLRSLEG
jgi:hypothetical protein